MALSEQIEALAKKHGATSYRNRADTQHPAYGFTPTQLLNLLAEVRKDDEALIRQMLEALEWLHLGASQAGLSRDPMAAITAARSRLEKAP